MRQKGLPQNPTEGLTVNGTNIQRNLKRFEGALTHQGVIGKGMRRKECQKSDRCIVVHVGTDQTHLNARVSKEVDKEATQAFNRCAEPSLNGLNPSCDTHAYTE